MKRILVYGMTSNMGGIETYLINIMNKMLPYNIIFDFVTDFPEIAYNDSLNKLGSKIFFIPAKKRNLLGHLYGLWKLLNEHPEYHVMYFNLLTSTGSITALIPKLLHRKVIIHSHNSNADNKLVHDCFKPLIRLVSDYDIACSKVAGIHMFGNRCLKDGKMLIVPNMIDFARYDFNIERRNQLRKEWKLDSNYLVCHVGRISEQKNPFKVIDIFEAVYKRESSARLLYVGTGELEDEIKAYTKEKGIEENVFFLGLRNDVEDILQMADVFLLPSKYEGLVIAALEAQASGLPCFLSDTITAEGDITDNVTHIPLSTDSNVWAVAILNSRNLVRHSVFKEIASSPYGLSNTNAAIDQLANIFINN